MAKNNLILKNSDKSVYLIILTWNHVLDTIECLDSVLKTSYSNFQVVVVDNASTDDTVKVIREKYPSVSLVENSENYGYAEGNNIGIRNALLNDPDYIFVLNNDTVIQPDTISVLIDELERNYDAIAVSPVSFYYDQPDKVYFAGGFISPQGKAVHSTSIKEEESYDTGWLNGCALMIRVEFLSSVGLFNPDYFLLFEDTDWSIRARKSGFSLRMVPKATILHKASASFQGQNSALLAYYYTRNCHLFFKNNFPINIRIGFHLNRMRRDFRSFKNTIKIIFRKEPKYRAVRLAYIDYFLRRFDQKDYPF